MRTKHERAKALACAVLMALLGCLPGIGPGAKANAGAPQVKLSAALGTPVLLAGEKQTAYLKVGLTGFPIEAHRAPVNLAIVLDKSGSMQGEKIAKAREAAIMAIRRLNSEDIISVIAYDTTVRVVVPATKLTDPEGICSQIQNITPGNTTALFAGVSKGAEEVRKFFSRERVNRIILLSDGLANVGPSSTADLARLGASLGKEGITVSTIGLGLGYNEDLMRWLAQNSDGSHFFAENATELASVFDEEFGKATSVAAQKIRIEIECADGVRPVRVLLRDAEIAGQHVVAVLNQLYGNAEKALILEVEVPAGTAGSNRELASVRVTYENMATGKTDTVASVVSGRFSLSRAEVEKAMDPSVMADVVEKIAVKRNELATALRDEGKVEEARKALLDNRAYLEINAAQYNSRKLKDYAVSNQQDADNLDGSSWTRQRKMQQRSQSSRY